MISVAGTFSVVARSYFYLTAPGIAEEHLYEQMASENPTFKKNMQRPFENGKSLKVVLGLCVVFGLSTLYFSMIGFN